MTIPNMYQRQIDLVPMEKVLKTPVGIIGVGAVGRNLAIALATAGVKHITCYDHDKIEEVNVPTQGWASTSVGQYKAACLCTYMNSRHSVATYKAVNEKYDYDKHGMTPMMFCCVDSIGTRQEIWEQAGDMNTFWCDARMMALNVRVLTAYDGASREKYGKTFFPEKEAEEGRCTARSAIWPAQLAACLMVNSYMAYLNLVEGNGMAPPTDVMINLGTYDFEIDHAPFVPPKFAAPTADELIAI